MQTGKAGSASMCCQPSNSSFFLELHPDLHTGLHILRLNLFHRKQPALPTCLNSQNSWNILFKKWKTSNVHNGISGRLRFNGFLMEMKKICCL